MGFLNHEKGVSALFTDEIMGVWGMFGIVLAGGMNEMFQLLNNLPSSGLRCGIVDPFDSIVLSLLSPV